MSREQRVRDILFFHVATWESGRRFDPARPATNRETEEAFRFVTVEGELLDNVAVIATLLNYCSAPEAVALASEELDAYNAALARWRSQHASIVTNRTLTNIIEEDNANAW